ncbi:MAG TPA: DUF4255 domain-containing protein [Polyangia bacterium]|nr:DUF4255 domain-containing protein [Polyangia bacterium]
MSNSLAIAAATATLRNLLLRVQQPLPLDPPTDSELADTVLSTKPPDKARASEDRNQLNLFLYQVGPNAAWRNMDLRNAVRPGELSMPPVAFNLYYLLTAYGRNFDDLLSHRLLGRAVTLLNDNSPLLQADIANALDGADLAYQPERVRVTPHALSAEEISKLWTVFQTPYRLSTAYEVSVILLQSNRPTVAAPPVVSRGADGRGPRAGTDLVAHVPTLTSITLPTDTQPAARLAYSQPAPPINLPGDVVTFVGHDLAAAPASPTPVIVNFTHPLFNAPIAATPAGPTAIGFTVTLPNDQVNWPAGFYTVGASIDRGTPHRVVTNSLAMAIAPRIITLTPTRDGAGNVSIAVKASPQIWPQQRASLLVGSSEFVAAPHVAGKTATLTFACGNLPPDTYAMRLRVDGVDSFLVDYTAATPHYDPAALVAVS